MILRKAVQLTQAVDPNAVGALLAEKMSQYANLLAAQGSIAAALTFLPANTDQVRGPQAWYSPSVNRPTLSKDVGIVQLSLEKPLRICWWCFSPWCVDLAELAEIHVLVLPYNFSELSLQTVSADKAVVAVISQPRFSCKKDLFQSNKADQASEETHICWCVAGKSLAGMHWAAVSALNLPLLSFFCSQTLCYYGTGFAEPKGSCQQDRRPLRHHMRDSLCPKIELALWRDRCQGLRLQRSSTINR